MTSMTTVEILEAARENIADPARWQKNEYGFIPHWRGLVSFDEGCYCALGSLMKVIGVDEGQIPGSVAAALAEAVNGFRTDFNPVRDIMSFNDRPETKHEDVIGAFDQAIEIAKAAA